MDILTFPAQLNSDSYSPSYLGDTALSESEPSGQAFSRAVAEAATVPRAMSTLKTTKNNLPLPMPFFHNPFDDPRFEKRSIVIVYSHTREERPLYLPVKIEPHNHPPTYNPGKEHFSIQSILGPDQSTRQSPSVTDNNRHPPAKISSQAPKAHQKKRNSKRQSECQRECQKEFQKERQKERNRLRQRERYKNDPEYAERQRERQRALRMNPAYVEHKRKLERQRYQNNPVFAEKKRQRNRERYHNNPVFAAQKRQLERQRYHNNPNYAKLRRELKRENLKPIIQ